MQLASLYLSAFSAIKDGHSLEVPVESAVALFLIKYLRHPVDVAVNLVQETSNEHQCQPSMSVNTKGFSCREIGADSLRRPAADCHLPVLTRFRGSGSHVQCVAGLCSVLRRLIKCSGEEYSSLLGFRGGCLTACAEVSLWTKFCEVDLVNSVNQLLTLQKSTQSQTDDLNDSVLNNAGKPSESVLQALSNVCRFEQHMKEYVRVHNIGKIRHETNQRIVEHKFAENNDMTLADLIILPCIHIIFEMVGFSALEKSVPVVSRWYKLVCSQDGVSDALCVLKPPVLGVVFPIIELPAVPSHSLYKSDPKRYRARSKLFTNQGEVECVLEAVGEQMAVPPLSEYPTGHQQPLDWLSLPDAVKPTVPSSRLCRKMQQLENLCKAVLEVAKSGDTIVDFCCGSGHLGILVAHLLPDCTVLLVDNNEESLAYAHKRVANLHLKNVSILQCNLDYFRGDFEVGMSLHACGVATDLVIQTCQKKKAAFVVCPCCYGGLQTNHKINYPQSRMFRESSISERHFLVLGHCADQTHKKLYHKSQQGERCMRLVDYDRCLQAQDQGYTVSVAKLVPSDCTPKNNLLVGVPHNC
ncbi:glutathione S-transferase C-terminal domain-containing protein homolog isoform X2 [Nilaparvata lugens]|uniref:glutathione S-transferase C-terminal domain-containing protein homolog isoform X2 n=1 Tax=Nilaparvata lugens TaxID=108931 RepID=UPI00193D15E8|nr:glutathione S-transferase C-terminal domain-containing protein homolog isoform X2 [Nilaparvata lugens]